MLKRYNETYSFISIVENQKYKIILHIMRLNQDRNFAIQNYTSVIPKQDLLK